MARGCSGGVFLPQRLVNVRVWDLSLWGREEEEAADSSESALLFFFFSFIFISWRLIT